MCNSTPVEAFSTLKGCIDFSREGGILYYTAGWEACPTGEGRLTNLPYG